MNDKYLKDAIAASFSRTDTAFLGLNKLLSVKWLPDGHEAIGYTQESPLTIFLAWDHEMFKPLSADEKMVVRLGVNGHELLHQLLTNFKYAHQVFSKYPQNEGAIFWNFFNLLEDAGIEYLAPTQFGGTLLDALRFTIKRLYELSSGIGKEPRAYYQLLNALVDFGDMGIVRGKFTFPEAEDMFRKVAPLFNEGVTCADSKKRVDIAEKIFLMAKPLWEPILKEKEEMEKFLKELAKDLSRRSEGSKEAQQQAKDGSSACKSEASKNRKKTLKEAGTETGTAEHGEGVENAESDGAESDDGSEGEESEKSGKKNSKSDSSGTSKNAKNSDTKKKAQKSTKACGDPTCSESADGAGGDSDEGNESESRSAHEIAESLASLIREEAKEEIDRQQKEREKEGREIEDFRPEGLGYDVRSLCIENSKVSKGDAYEYARITQAYAWAIKKLTSEFEKLLEPERETSCRATSGSYNIMRGAIGTTARIFDKKRLPGGKKDVAICLCIDNSGSMRCNDSYGHTRKIDAAVLSSIILSEACAKLKIPLAVIGYSADRSGYDANHQHFVTFKDISARTSLVTMQAHGNNFDGFSIRYAAEMLKKRRESVKILFVISDGQPAARKYHGNSGYADTAAAVKDAKKVVNVFGIGLGTDCTPDVLMKFYGADFIHCPTCIDLPNLMSKEMTKIIKKQLKKS